ncbi:MAG TPA: hypothetical protein H9774_08025 [Candidatus Desulfovibrio gallistercoris]|uniref:hypothetical protein n=1 Tax=uncultured Desulfovibrio sp. TaxID=167968 RepID=UPI001FA62D6E|nr:hypothetical protein [uncultured Desulfovibrio sp.]HJA76793.1 hypothetical protein [Candidatus Desulfovibrio gallistercoris]
MGAVEMKLGITGAPVDVSVSMQINLAAMLEDPARSFPAMARILGALLVEEYRLATPDMPENDTN